MSFIHTHAWTIKAPPERVFQALTDPADLKRWFAEDVQVEPRENGVFRFWGRHTLGTPAQDAARQTVARFDPPAALAFRWPLFEVDTDVTIALAPHEKGTTLSLTHEVSGDLPHPRQRELIDDHWRFAMGNLMAHLKGKPPTLPDYFATKPEVRITMDIDAPPSTVFRALMEPERVKKWLWSKEPVIEPQVNGRYDLGWSYEVEGKSVHGGPTRILALEQDRKLVLDWPDYRGDPNVPDQTITFLLEPRGSEGTTLTFVHAGFTRTTDISDYPFGWDGFLAGLKKEATS
jgi:uncharacterized protein YndB with AHSA1/START domain